MGAIVAAIFVVGGSTVWAHSNLLAASPGPGAIVGGTITTITLQYANQVVEFEGSVTGPDGAMVDSTFEIISPTRVTISLADPLELPGEYAVRHSTRAEDTDLVSAAFLFTFDFSAPPPQFLQVDTGDGTPWFVWVVGAVGTLVVLVLSWRLVDALRRHRRSTPET